MTNSLYGYDTLQSLALYVVLGIDPGSFGQALLLDNIKQAYKTAHSVLKQEKIIEGMLEFTKKNLPYQCRGSKKNITRWIAHKGLSGADLKIRTLVRLEMTDYWFLEIATSDIAGFDFNWLTGEVYQL